MDKPEYLGENLGNIIEYNKECLSEWFWYKYYS